MKSLTEFIQESLVNESSTKKTYSIQNNIGKSKYVVNFNDGIKQHKDGSLFFDTRIFKNKQELSAFIKDLENNGFVQESLYRTKLDEVSDTDESQETKESDDLDESMDRFISRGGDEKEED